MYVYMCVCVYIYIYVCIYIYIYVICGPVTGICKHINEFSDPKTGGKYY